MDCNCVNLYDQDCEAEACKDERRRNRTAMFDFMICVQMEEQFKDD